MGSVFDRSLRDVHARATQAKTAAAKTYTFLGVPQERWRPLPLSCTDTENLSFKIESAGR